MNKISVVHAISMRLSLYVQYSTQFSMKHEIILSRGRSFSSSPSTDSKRDMSVSSSVFSMNYTEKIEAQSNNLTWAEQIESRE